MKKYAEDEINKIKAKNNNFNLDKSNIMNKITIFKNKRQLHHASKHNSINGDQIDLILGVHHN